MLLMFNGKVKTRKAKDTNNSMMTNCVSLLESRDDFFRIIDWDTVEIGLFALFTFAEFSSGTVTLTSLSEIFSNSETLLSPTLILLSDKVEFDTLPKWLSFLGLLCIATRITRFILRIETKGMTELTISINQDRYFVILSSFPTATHIVGPP